MLSALVIAYGLRDSIAYQNLFDSTYTGTSIDLNDLGSLDFIYSDELAHIRRLARTPGLTASMDLGPEATWNRLPSDDPSHPEWSTILISGSSYSIEITEGTTVIGAIGEAGTFQEFTFEPTLDSASPTDTLWQIVRWRETGRSGF